MSVLSGCKGFATTETEYDTESKDIKSMFVEVEKNMYKRTRNGLKLIDSEVMEVIRKEDHHQFRL